MKTRRLGKLLIPALVGITATMAAASCKDAPTATVAQPSFSAQFDAFWKTFDANYSYFDYKHVDWTAERAVFSKRLPPGPSEFAFIDYLASMAAPLRDVHVKFIDPSGFEFPSYEPTTTENWDAGISKRSLASANFVQVTPYLGYGRIRGVGYIQVSQWDDVTTTAADLNAALAHFKGETRLIVDVRMNGGGDDTLAYDFAARFNDAKRVVGYYQVRNGPQHGDFSPLAPRVLGVRGPFRFDGRVLVLAGRYSFSANESFISAMRQLPDVSILGDTTGGGSGHPQTYDLGDGYRFTVPRWIEYTADHRVIEWNGIPPDLYVPWDAALVKQGRDPVLETALMLLGASAN